MKSIRSIHDDTPLYSGQIFRVFGVERLDVMKLKKDRSDKNKMKQDYYDYMIVDVNLVAKNVFVLMNVTLDNDNRGAILYIFDNITQGFVNALVIKQYFAGHLDNIKLL